jgi:hypothetical protein
MKMSNNPIVVDIGSIEGGNVVEKDFAMEEC